MENIRTRTIALWRWSCVAEFSWVKVTTETAASEPAAVVRTVDIVKSLVRSKPPPWRWPTVRLVGFDGGRRHLIPWPLDDSKHAKELRDSLV